jgi:hypothetical protein
MDLRVLAVVPHVLVVVDLNHSGVDQFLHLHIDVGFAVPGVGVVGVFGFVFPQIIGETVCLLFGNGAFNYNITVGGPEIPVFFGEDAEGFAVAPVIEVERAGFGGRGIAGNLFVGVDGGGLRFDDRCRCHVLLFMRQSYEVGCF